MDLPRLAVLKQIEFRLSAEGNKAIYLAQDNANGRIFTIPHNLVLLLRKAKFYTQRNMPLDEAVDKDGAREVYKFLHMVTSMRDIDTINKKPINPVFMNIPLFDVGRFQPSLLSFANSVVGKSYFGFLAILILIACILGVRNDWSILEVFGNVFSLQALVMFGVMAPFLKIIHEFGHVLVATKAGVQVRKAGVYLIGLYPMPYVDCTEADMTAKRTDRIAISAAGIIVDVTIGLGAFILWYLIEGNYLRTLMGNIFVYSALNSVLFNANPLIKLDGYYVLTDFFGSRNLYTRASKTMQDLQLNIMSLGGLGARPAALRHWGLILYAGLAFLYRLNILFVIASTLIPKYLGIGFAVTVWGGFIMFLSPLMQDKVKQPPKPVGSQKRIYAMRFLILACVVLALLFVKMPFRTMIPVTLDVADQYQFTVKTRGHIASVAERDDFAKDTPILVLRNLDLQDRLAVTKSELETALLNYETVRGEDPTKAQAAQDAVTNTQTQLNLLEVEVRGLQSLAPENGIFVRHMALRKGAFLESGAAVGAFFPSQGQSKFSGPFDERYYDKFQAGPDMVTLRIGGTYTDLPLTAVALQSTITLDTESGTRSYTLKTSFPKAPSTLSNLPAAVRLRFPPEPLWRHAQFIGQNIIANFRESQLLDRQKLLND